MSKIENLNQKIQKKLNIINNLKLKEEKKRKLQEEQEAARLERKYILQEKKRKLQEEQVSKRLEKEFISKNRSTTFISKAIGVFADKFNYDNIIFKRIDSRKWIFDIKCNECNTFFDQREYFHLKGHNGCNTCNSQFHNISTYKGRHTTLYYLKINNLYKIGLTMSSIQKRYNHEKNNPLIYNIEEIKSWDFDDGELAYKLEQKILFENKSQKYNYKRDGKVLSGGNSELFEQDIIENILALLDGNSF